MEIFVQSFVVLHNIVRIYRLCVKHVFRVCVSAYANVRARLALTPRALTHVSLISNSAVSSVPEILLMDFHGTSGQYIGMIYRLRHCRFLPLCPGLIHTDIVWLDVIFFSYGKLCKNKPQEIMSTSF
jgi:hypothetical protein